MGVRVEWLTSATAGDRTVLVGDVMSTEDTEGTECAGAVEWLDERDCGRPHRRSAWRHDLRRRDSSTLQERHAMYPFATLQMSQA